MDVEPSPALPADDVLLLEPLVRAANPAASGSYATAYLVGSGRVTPPLDDGTPAAAQTLSGETLPTTVTVGGMPAQVLFAGMAPGFVGLVQIDFQVPDLPAGDYPIQVTIGAAQSNTPTMMVGPSGG
jgi:uncharacterized protein (TIGR03437 family)